MLIKSKKLLTMLIIVAMVFNVLPLNSFATEQNYEDNQEITRVSALDDAVALQEFSVGQEDAQVILPEVVEVQITETTWSEVEIEDLEM